MSMINVSGTQYHDFSRGILCGALSHAGFGATKLFKSNPTKKGAR
jgi:hypothetical protein